MINRYNITDIVAKAQKDAPLPDDYRDLPASMVRRIETLAEANGSTPARVYEAMKAQAEQDAATTDDAAAIAKAARR